MFADRDYQANVSWKVENLDQWCVLVGLWEMEVLI